jgi:hypothetical protein
MPEAIEYSVPDTDIMPVEAQPKSMACWATVTTMLMSWKDQVCYPIESAMDTIGAEYRKIYEDNTGLYPDKIEAFTQATGLTIEWPQCETPESMLALLQNYGVLVIIDDEDPSAAFAVHARLVTGIRGDGTPDGTFLTIVDPAGGRTYEESFSSFANKYESMSSAAGWTIQMMHY